MKSGSARTPRAPRISVAPAAYGTFAAGAITDTASRRARSASIAPVRAPGTSTSASTSKRAAGGRTERRLGSDDDAEAGEHVLERDPIHRLRHHPRLAGAPQRREVGLERAEV